MRILVTGAAGFIGSTIAAGLLQGGQCQVIGLCRDLAGNAPASGVLRVAGDLTREFPPVDGVDYIVHCAALQNPSGISAHRFIAANLDMMENVLQFALRSGVKGIVFTSSVDLHGEVASGVLDEGTGRVNPSLYGVSKYLCELMLRDYQARIPSVAVRLCGVIGPGAEKCWIARILAQALRGKDIGIVNEDALFNNVLHTDDLLGLLRGLFSRGFTGFSAFPVASAAAVSIREAVAEIIRLTGSRSKIVSNGASANSFTISNRCAMDRFQYQPGGVAENLKKYVTEMHRLQTCSGMEH